MGLNPYNRGVKIRPMLTQKEWVEKCYERYARLGMNPGDSYWVWEKAHYPLPQGMGDKWIWLTHEDHQIQGILQSEEYGDRYFFPGYPKRVLDRLFVEDWFEIYDLYDKWQKIAMSRVGKICLESHKKNGTGFFNEETQRLAHARAAETNRRNGTGFNNPETQQKAVQAHRENGTGFFDPEFHKRPTVIEGRRRGCQTSQERGVGIHDPEVRARTNPLMQAGRERAQKIVWVCTGGEEYFGSSSAITRFQRHRGIPEDMRRLATPEETEWFIKNKARYIADHKNKMSRERKSG